MDTNMLSVCPKCGNRSVCELLDGGLLCFSAESIPAGSDGLPDITNTHQLRNGKLVAGYVKICGWRNKRT